MADLSIEVMTTAGQIDEVLAVEEVSFTNPWTREMYLSELEHRDVSFFYIARDAVGEAIGFCSCWLVLDEIHINNLAVLPEHRRGGVASALLDHVLAEGASAGRDAGHARSAALERPARALYERFGFVVAAVRRGLLQQASGGRARAVARLADLARLILNRPRTLVLRFAPAGSGSSCSRTSLPIVPSPPLNRCQGGGV